MKKCVYLKEAKYIEDFRIYLRFNDGLAAEIDLENEIRKYRAAEPLKSRDKFSQFYLDSWPTLAWECGFDLAPESLYAKCEQVVATDADKRRC